MSITDLLKDDSYTFINTKNKGDNIGNVVINHLSEKLIEQYELRITEKDGVIKDQKQTIKNLENIIKTLQEN
jgi:hypothetical protein